MPTYFQVLTPGIKAGKNFTTSGSCAPGHLLQVDSTGLLVSKCTTSGCPFGFAYGARSLVYSPTSVNYPTGERITVVRGDFECLISAHFFYGGSLPSSANTALYAYTGGLLRAGTGTTQVGRYIRSKTVTQPGTNLTVGYCRMTVDAD